MSSTKLDFDWDKDVSLALQDLEDYVKPEILEYVKQVVGVDEEASGASSRPVSKLSYSPEPSFQFDPTPTPTERSPLKEEGSSSTDTKSFMSYTIRDLGRLSLLDKEMDLLSPTALCSQLPMCRKIMLKSDILQNSSATGRSGAKPKVKARPSHSRGSQMEDEGQKRELDKIDKIYGTLVGRINTKKAAEFRRGRKLHQDPHAGGVRQFEASVSNPLYKKYQPEGYVKTEDEVVIEFIGKITADFNSWLSKFDGDLKQVDAALMLRLLRWDLELPFSTE